LPTDADADWAARTVSYYQMEEHIEDGGDILEELHAACALM
jgi:hypothetical protein